MARKPVAVTLNFFPKGDDLPLFSGACVRPVERPFDPQAQPQQEVLFDLRLDPFHTRQEAPHDPTAE